VGFAYWQAGCDEHNVTAARRAHVQKHDVRVVRQVQKQAAAVQMHSRLQAAAGSATIAARNLSIVAHGGRVSTFQRDVRDNTAGHTAVARLKESGRTHGWAGGLQALGFVLGLRGDVRVYDDAGCAVSGELIDVAEAVVADDGTGGAIAGE
jgi:hypothetical protein